MEKGDLVIITEELPNWDWLSYRMGDMGILMETRDYGPLYEYRICKIFLLRTEKIESIPENFLSYVGI